MEKKSKMTIDDLALVLAGQFSSIDQRFEQIDQRFKQIDQRFDKVDQRFDRLENKMVNEFALFRRDLKEVIIRLDRLEKRTMEDDDALANDVVELRERVCFLETEFKKLKLAKS